MSALKQKLMRQIALTGPISVADYFAACLFDPEHGYYLSREPFGAKGDFTTAPEISQLFGELLAIWAFENWQRLDRPSPFVFAEIGPGRGTMMADMLRVLSKLDNGAMLDAARIVLIEASPRLSAMQRERLKDFPGPIEWVADISALPDLPLLLLGNELFDAVPVRQLIKRKGRWHERMIGAQSDALIFLAGAAPVDDVPLPPDADSAPDGAIAEISSQRAGLMSAIAAHIAANGGAALFPDYGYAQPTCGDTLQALRVHAFDDVLAHPGEADLTAHVDFSALANAARQHGLETALREQGAFLLGLGLLQRAGALGAKKSAETQEAISQSVERLAAPDQMGTLFKVLGLGAPARLWMG